MGTLVPANSPASGSGEKFAKPASEIMGGSSKPSSEGDLFNLLADVEDSSEKDGHTTADESEDGIDGDSEADEAEESTQDDQEDTDEAGSEDEEDEAVENEIKNAAGVSFKQLKAAYPDIFKKFPQLQHAIGQHQGYKEVFTTVNDAREAAEKTKVFDFLDGEIVQGNLSPIFKGFHNKDTAEGTNTLGKIAERLLPDLLATDEKAFKAATRPLITTLLRNMKRTGASNGNKNLGIAADIASEFIFGTKELPNEERADPDLERQRLQLKTREEQLESREYTRHATEVHEKAVNRVYKEVASRIDPEGVLSEFDRDAKTEKVFKELSRQLEADPVHMRIMQGLKQRLIRSGYSEEEKARFLGTYLARAKPVLGPILRRASTAVNGKSKPVTRNDGRRVIPSTSKVAPSFKGGKLPPIADLKKSGMSVLDLLNKTAGD